jgi:hypothetical protein
MLAVCRSIHERAPDVDACAWSLVRRELRTPNGREEDAEKHQKAVGATHIDGSCKFRACKVF